MAGAVTGSRCVQGGVSGEWLQSHPLPRVYPLRAYVTLKKERRQGHRSFQALPGIL